METVFVCFAPAGIFGNRIEISGKVSDCPFSRGSIVKDRIDPGYGPPHPGEAEEGLTEDVGSCGQLGKQTLQT